MKYIARIFLAALTLVAALSCSEAGDGAPSRWGDASSWYVGSNAVPDSVDVFYLVSTNVLSAYDADSNEVYRANLTAEDLGYLDQEIDFVHENIFGQDFNFFSPYYHQFTMDATKLPEEEFRTVFSEVSAEACEAFDYYMEHMNNGRRFILAGFSQGAMLTLEVLKHMTDEQYNRMVATYAMGYRLSEEDLENPHIKAAQGESDTQVVVSFNSVLSEDGIWPFVSGNSVTCINPVNWTTDSTAADFTYTEGDTALDLTISVNEADNILYVSGGEDFFHNWMDNSFFATTGISHDCLHHWDILFYDSIIHDNAILRSQRLDLTKTLRCDYLFSGTSDSQDISLYALRSMDGWAGRQVNMDRVPLKGNGQICMKDERTGDVLYMMSFSTLFREWQATEEASRVRKSFENVFLLPMPKDPATVTVTLFDIDGEACSTFTHRVDPSDILIRPASSAPEYRYLHKAGSPEDCIDVAIVAEGYTEREMPVFYRDAQNVVDALWDQEPFASMKDRFNIVAVATVSNDSGVSIPAKGEWKDTAVMSNFDTFYSSRYLTTTHIFRMHDALAGVPYEHLIVLANTDTYGGGGIYNSYTLTTAHHSKFKPVVVHEFGHSFAGLADEYYYDDQYENLYKAGVEPWEQNITTLADFSSKWESMLPDPKNPETEYTPEQQEKVKEIQAEVGRKYASVAEGAKLPGEGVIIGRNEDWPEFKVGLYEGAGYMSKGVYRGYPECRMKINEYPEFCPVCQKAIRDIINFYTVQM